MTRREFIDVIKGGALFSLFPPFSNKEEAKPKTGMNTSAPNLNNVFQIKNIPDQPFYFPQDRGDGNHHMGLDTLLNLMGEKGLKFYRSSKEDLLSGPSGLIAPQDVVLIKVNAQWKYRGCTNSDLIRGLIQRILDHPDVFTGEVVIFENGQGRGSLNCDTSSSYLDSSIRANANDERHTFLYLVNTVFNDPRVSSFLLDPIRSTFIGANDHATNGFRRFENVSYPCFFTEGGNRVELREGIWNGNSHNHNLKMINVPVLKHHDTGGSEITASLKHMYGVVSMNDGYSSFRHYSGLGETCGKVIASVSTPVLNIIDAIWVSHSSLGGYPENTTHRANQILASQDPVALDYWATKYVLHPIDYNSRHHPDFAGIDVWLQEARDTINNRGGLKDPEKGVVVDWVTKEEAEMQAFTRNAQDSPVIYVPINFTGEKVLNRSLSQPEYIDALTWQPNLRNENILEYRIYMLTGNSQIFLAKVDFRTYEYWHRNVNKTESYSYALVAVNNEGIEGEPVFLTVQ